MNVDIIEGRNLKLSSIAFRIIAVVYRLYVIFLHHSAATKMALEILEFAVYRTPCPGFDFDGW